MWKEENRRTRRKTLGARTRTNNELNPRMTPDQNRARATLVGGERSHHCAIPAPLAAMTIGTELFSVIDSRMFTILGQQSLHFEFCSYSATFFLSKVTSSSLFAIRRSNGDKYFEGGPEYCALYSDESHVLVTKRCRFRGGDGLILCGSTSRIGNCEKH